MIVESDASRRYIPCNHGNIKRNIAAAVIL